MGVCQSIFCPNDREKFRSTKGHEQFAEVQELTHWKAMYDSTTISNSVFFFPDAKLPCFRYLDDGKLDHHHRDKCKFAHEETSLVKLIRVMRLARRTLDICVFTVTNDSIANEVMAAHKRGVKVRVITDDGQRGNRGSDIEKFVQVGIEVKDDGNAGNYMHHKFAMIDDRLLVNGSYNWSVHATLSNNENVVVSNDPLLIRSFRSEFERLWAIFKKSNIQYNPK
mmetsp:Transcript_18543/g.31177  ORF Transcript_18543/g.31177 Transcript_18543/m.31177 type:complete len:224 (+) Transcript_18543:131-802(+)